MLFINGVPSLKHFKGVFSFLKAFNIFKERTGKVFASPLYSEKTQMFWWTKDYKNTKIAKRSHAYKGYVSTAP